jgi:threonine dehydratase
MIPGDAPPAFSVQDVLEAEQRIMPYLRDTPIMSAWLTRDDGSRLRVSLKLDSLQVTGGTLVRGVLNAALQMPPEQLRHGLVGFGTAHGSATAFSAQVLEVPAVVFMAHSSASPDVVRAIEQSGGRVFVSDATIAEARESAVAAADRDGLIFIDPQASSRSLIVGCATIVVEMLDALPGLDVLVTFVGRGELISGVALAAKQLKPALRVVGIDKAPPGTRREFAHADSSRLTPGTRLQRSGQVTMDLVNRYVDELVLVTDQETERAAHVLWSELEVRTGYTGSGAVAATLSGKVAVRDDEHVGIVISRAGGGGLF